MWGSDSDVWMTDVGVEGNWNVFSTRINIPEYKFNY